MNKTAYALGAVALATMLTGAGCTASTSADLDVNDDAPGIDVQVNGGASGRGGDY